MKLFLILTFFVRFLSFDQCEHCFRFWTHFFIVNVLLVILEGEREREREREKERRKELERERERERQRE